MSSRERGLGRLGGLKQHALDVEQSVAAIRERFGDLKDKKPTVVSSFNLFPTPPAIAKRMIEKLEMNKPSGLKVLEPSFGTGRLIEAMQNKNLLDWNLVTGVEINADLVDHLKNHSWNFTAICGDFLEMGKTFGSPLQYETFDRVVMNPPFKNGIDRKHIDHALKMLKPGGRLVSLIANGPRQQEWWQRTRIMKCYPTSCWVHLDEGSFACEGTNVSTAIITLEKS